MQYLIHKGTIPNMMGGSQEALTQTLFGALFPLRASTTSLQHLAMTREYFLQDKLPAPAETAQTDPKQELPTGSGGTQMAPTAVLESFGTLLT